MGLPKEISLEPINPAEITFKVFCPELIAARERGEAIEEGWFHMPKNGDHTTEEQVLMQETITGGNHI